MLRPIDTMQTLSNVMQTGLLFAEANAVIWMRVWGMAGVWSVTPSENKRMVSEKIEASQKAMLAASKVAMRGGTPDAVTAAAIKPYRQKTRANSKRLAKRGLKES